MKREDFYNVKRFFPFFEYEIEDAEKNRKIIVIEFVDFSTFANYQLMKEEFGNKFRKSQVLTTENSKPCWGEWVELES